MNKTSRIINYFSVVGIGKKLTPQDSQYQKGFYNKKIYLKERSITGLDIVQGAFNDEIPQRDNEKWIDLDGGRQLWIKATFDSNQRPITNINFFYLHYEDEHLKIPLSCDYVPILIKKKFESHSKSTFKGISNGFSYYQGNFDLTHILDSKTKKGYQLVLCYRVQSQINFDEPLCDLQLLKAERDLKKRKTTLSSDLKLIIPKDYNILEFAFGLQEKNRFLAFKKRQSHLKIAYMPKIIDRYPIEDYPDQPLLPSIPMFCFPEGIKLSETFHEPIFFTFILTSELGERTYCTCLTFYEKLSQQLYDQLGHIQHERKIFQPITICFISKYEYSYQCKELLKHLYRLHLSKNDIPLEVTICNMVDNIRLPISSQDYGQLGIKYEVLEPIIFQTNLSYPICSDDSIRALFTVLDVERIILLFECVLLEKKIHLISNHISLPGLITEALLTLIFPFEYTHMLVPVLPDSLRNYSEAPVPFLIGYSQKNIYAYLDTNFVVNIECLPPLHQKAHKQLRKRLQPYECYYDEEMSRPYLQQVDSAFPLFIDESGFAKKDIVKSLDTYDIRDAFFEFLLSVMKDYNKCFVNNFLMIMKKIKFPKNKQKPNGDCAEIFNLKEFLTIHKSTKEDTFLNTFSETRFFSYFIQERYRLSPRESYYQFFDRCMELSKQKKHQQFIKREQPLKIHGCQGPTQTCQNNKVYVYEQFPQLSPDLFLKKLNLYEDGYDELNKQLHEKYTEEDLESIEHAKWAKYLLETIYKIWFQFFIIKVRNNMENEEFSRLTNYAIVLIEYMRQNNLLITEQLFRYTLEACGYFRMDEKALFLVHEMKQMKIETSPSTHGVYFLAIAKAMNSKGLPQKPEIQSQHELKVEKNIENTLDRNQSQDFVLQSFQSHKATVFRINDNCPNCHRQLYFEEILDGFKKNFYDNHTRCINGGQNVGCGKEFVAKFQVTAYEDEKPIEVCSYDVYSPLNVLREIENLIKAKGETYLLSELFEKQQKCFFMNIILYMDIIKLPVFFFCPKIKEEDYESNFQKMEKQMIKQMNQIKQNSIFSKIFKEFDIYKQELEKIGVRQSIIKEEKVKEQSESSSGSLNGSTKQEQKQVNFASKAIKKVFGDLIKEFTEDNELRFIKPPLQQVIQIKIQQNEEQKDQSSPLKSKKN